MTSCHVCIIPSTCCRAVQEKVKKILNTHGKSEKMTKSIMRGLTNSTTLEEVALFVRYRLFLKRNYVHNFAHFLLNFRTCKSNTLCDTRKETKTADVFSSCWCSFPLSFLYGHLNLRNCMSLFCGSASDVFITNCLLSERNVQGWQQTQSRRESTWPWTGGNGCQDRTGRYYQRAARHFAVSRRQQAWYGDS